MDKAQLTIAILTALTPTVAVFLATLIQRQDVRDLRVEMNGLRKDLNAEMNTLRKDLNAEMNTSRNDFQAQMISLRNQVHADMLMIHERVATVEAKQS